MNQKKIKLHRKLFKTLEINNEVKIINVNNKKGFCPFLENNYIFNYSTYTLINNYKRAYRASKKNI